MEIPMTQADYALAYSLQNTADIRKMQEEKDKELSHRSLSDTLLFRTNISKETLDKMRWFRTQVYNLSVYLEAQGKSAELTLAFRNLESALHYGIKHFCLTDPQATKEDLTK